MIVAKPVIPNQYWILRQDDRKIGNIEAGEDGYQVKINNQVQTFKTINMVKQRIKIDFEKIQTAISKSTEVNEINGYPTDSRPYNVIFDVRLQAPLWTREERSKSWYAAGWFRVKQGRNWQTVLCPKLITLQRYPYQGPYRTQEEADQL
jgi:hypothetical protein